MLGITGVVQNQDDGSVSIEAEGTSKQLQKFTEWCRNGPDTASVDALDTKSGKVKNYKSFEVI